MLCLSFPINVSASESLFAEKATNHSQNSKNNFIGSGYNEAGIHYEIYGENILTCSSSSLIITRTVIYDAIVKPNDTLYWQENISGTLYSGTLSLIEFSFNNGKTTAIYQGTVYK